MSEIAQLEARIAQLEKEVQSLKDVSIFADIKPSIEEDPTKYKEVRISTVNLHYKIKYTKKGIVKELYERLARDLYKPVEQIELLSPVNGSKLTEEDELSDYIEDGVVRLDFQYVQVQGHCGHNHNDDEDEDDEFSDDENFYTGCSCAHHT